MGHEQDKNWLDARRRQAQAERMIGDVQAFGCNDLACPACGHNQLVKKWCYGKDPLSDNPREEPCPVVGRHLHGICGMCQYQWLEQALMDVEPGPDGSLPVASSVAAREPVVMLAAALLAAGGSIDLTEEIMVEANEIARHTGSIQLAKDGANAKGRLYIRPPGKP